MKTLSCKHYQIPKWEVIISEIVGGRYFSTQNASQGFWQLKLNEEKAPNVAHLTHDLVDIAFQDCFLE